MNEKNSHKDSQRNTEKGQKNSQEVKMENNRENNKKRLKTLILFLAITACFRVTSHIGLGQIIPETYTINGFVVEEYPIDRPNYEPPDAKKKRARWRNSPTQSETEQLEQINKKLNKLGYRLIKQDSMALYDFYKNTDLLADSIYRILHFSMNKNQQNFVFWAEKSEEKGGITVLWCEDGIIIEERNQREMKQGDKLYAYYWWRLYPIFCGDELVWCELIFKPSDERQFAHWQGYIKNSKKILYRFKFLHGAGGLPVYFKSFHGGWLLGITDYNTPGRVIYNGEELWKKYNCEGIWEYTLLKGKPFFFFTKPGDKKIHMMYDGKEVPFVWYDYIGNNGFLGGTEANDTMIWFFALRENQSFYVEAGIYE
jgi:hypothetical protein